jgi:predicted transcriptional regulator
MEKIKNIRLKESLLFLISKKIINQSKINWRGDFESNIKQGMEESIKDKYNDMNEKFSELRKSGKDLGVLNFKLMIIPLKIKIFTATYEKKDAENIIKRMEEIENEINSIKK